MVKLTAFVSCLLLSFACHAQQKDTVRIYFSTGNDLIQPRYQAQLDSVAALVQDQTSSAIEIFGYTDPTGLPGTNQALAENRAKAIKKYLLNAPKPVNQNQIITCRGVAQKPGAAGAPHAQLRRAEIILTQRKADLQNLQAGQTITLRNLDFLPGRHLVTPQSKPALDSLVLLLQQYPTIHIEIQGHICCQAGTDGLDEDTGKKELSKNRAKYVYNYLVQNGVAANRLTYKGYGRTKPLVMPERTEADRQKNRRVEIKIVSR